MRYSPNGGGFIDKGLDMGEIVNGWVDVDRAGSVSVPCPIGDLVGEPHEFAAGSGRLAFMDIMGKAGRVHEVCLACAHPSSEAVVVGGLELASNGVQTRAEWVLSRLNRARIVASHNSSERVLLGIIEEFAVLLVVHFAEVEG